MVRTSSLPSEWTSGIVESDGIHLQYLRSGGNKSPLVALHGLIGSGACLSPLARPLEASFDVILPDARGHGRSSAPARGYAYEDMASDVIALTRELKLNRPVLVGHSMGGMTAAVVGAMLGSAVSAIILIDPTFINLEWQREVYGSNIAAEHGELLALARDDLITKARHRSPSRPPDMIELLVDARLQTSPFAFEVLTPPNPDYKKLTEKIAVPTLLLIGEHGVVSLEAAQGLKRLNPCLSYDVIPGASHGMPYDEPEQLAAAILSFLTSNGLGRRDVERQTLGDVAETSHRSTGASGEQRR